MSAIRASLGKCSILAPLSAAILGLLIAQGEVRGAPKPAPKTPAKPVAKPSPAKSKKDVREERSYKALASAWSYFYAGKLKESAEAIASLVGSDAEWARVEALHIQARCLYAAGPQYHARADQIWKRIHAQSTLNTNLVRLEVSKALAAVAANRPADAASTLEAVLQRGIPGTCVPEAAIELGRARVSLKQWDQAKKAYEFAISYSQSQSKTSKELPGFVYDPFAKAAKAALDRLKYDRDEGREEFERAEKLRAEKKYTDAGKLYQAITKKYPESNYAPRSELHTGHCLLGMGQASQAVQHWQKFISLSPSGPWRGQAYSEIIDLCLQQVFDLDNALRFAQLAQTSLASALADEAAGPSWRACTFDLQLAMGIVAFIRGDNCAAADAFSRAASTAPKGVKRNFPALIAAAKENKPLLPPDVFGTATLASYGVSGTAGTGVSGAEKGAANVSLALAMGRIYRIAGDEDASRRMFGLVASAKLGRPSSAQLAYAKFATGDALDADRKHAEAKDQYVESLRAFPRGSWQDEALFRVARFIQSEADKKFGLPDGKNKPVPDPSSKEEQERLKKLTAATSESLEYWAALVQHFPKSRHQETALVQATRIFAHTHKWSEAVATADKLAAEYPANKSGPGLLFEIGQGLISAGLFTDAVRMADRLHQAYHNDQYPPILLQDVGLQMIKSGRGAGAQEVAEKLLASWPQHSAGPRILCEAAALVAKAENWTTVTSLLERAIKAAPKGPYAGIACLMATDICVEHVCDLQKAQEYANLGLEWAKSNPNLQQVPDLLHPPVISAPFSGSGFVDPQRPVRAFTPGPNRMFLRELYARAGLVLYLSGKPQEAEPLFRSADSMVASATYAAFSFGRSGGLIEAIQRKVAITPDDVRTGDSKSGLLLQLADLYSCAGNYQKTCSLCTRVFESRTAGVTKQQKSYALFRRGRAEYCLGSRKRDLSRVKADYLAASDLAPETKWAAKGLFLAGNISFNHDRDYDRAIAAWKRVLQKSPQSEDADRCAYYIGIAYEASNRAPQAKDAYEQFIRQFPTSKFVSVVQSNHLPALQKPAVPQQKQRK